VETCPKISPRTSNAGRPRDERRWHASILKGETSIQEAARAHGLTVAKIEGWKERYLSAAENALCTRPKDEEALKDEQIKKLKQKVGELVLDIDILKEAQKGRPFARETSDE
jgi:hypothetical protein